MEKMTEMEALCELVVLELIEVKMHICNGRDFEGGVGLGGLINSLLYRKDAEEDKRKKNEEVQDEECDEECEESSEEEDESEDKEESYYLQYLREQKNRVETEKSFQELLIKNKKLEETNQSINETKRCIFELQDLLMRLVKFKKVSKEEVDNVLNILRNTGVDKSDINIICKGLIK